MGTFSLSLPSPPLLSLSSPPAPSPPSLSSKSLPLRRYRCRYFRHSCRHCLLRCCSEAFCCQFEALNRRAYQPAQRECQVRLIRVGEVQSETVDAGSGSAASVLDPQRRASALHPWRTRHLGEEESLYRQGDRVGFLRNGISRYRGRSFVSSLFIMGTTAGVTETASTVGSSALFKVEIMH